MEKSDTETPSAERDADRSLVFAGGVLASWLDGGGEFAVTGLPTHHGVDFVLCRAAGGDVAMTVTGIDMPPGGIVLRPPVARPP